MPLYILMVVDGNGESEIVALWLVSSEDESTIGFLMDVFRKYNDTSKTQCVMADKDMTERNIITEKLPNAKLLICLFHTLRSFRREITTEKMGITAAQRVTVLDLISKLAYAQSEEAYQVIYEKLLEMKLKSVLNYYDEHWHHIRDQWVEGLKHDSCHYLNSTNNRLEAINQKINSVVSKYSSVVTFFKELMKCLDSLALERDHRAVMAFHKVFVTQYAENTPLYEYQKHLTPYAFSYVVTQFSLADKIKVTESIDQESLSTKFYRKERAITTSIHTCTCGFFKAMQLPCRHIVSLRRQLQLDLFGKQLCGVRWTRSYYKTAIESFLVNLICKVM